MYNVQRTQVLLVQVRDVPCRLHGITFRYNRVPKNAHKARRVGSIRFVVPRGIPCAGTILTSRAANDIFGETTELSGEVDQNDETSSFAKFCQLLSYLSI